MTFQLRLSRCYTHIQSETGNSFALIGKAGENEALFYSKARQHHVYFYVDMETWQDVKPWKGVIKKGVISEV